MTPTAGTTITNQATVSATTADPALVNNSASASTTVDPIADLSLTNSDSPDPVLSGQRAHLHARRSQHRPRERDRVSSLSDTLPAGVTFVSATTTQGSCIRSGNTVICALGTIASGADTTVTIKVNTGAPERSRTTRPCCPPPPTRTPPTTRQAPSTTVKPVADLALDEVRLARPGAGRRAADLHPRASRTPGPRTRPA